jgi:hypothetical protein
MYVQNRKGLGDGDGDGVSPISIVASVVSVLKGIFGKTPWAYGMVALVNHQWMGGFFTVYAYLKRTDRIKYWFDLITTTKGVGIDSGPDYLYHLQDECVQAAINAGISKQADFRSFTPGSVAQALFEKGWADPVAENGSWSPPEGLVAAATDTTTGTTTTGTTAQASIFSGFLPIALIGGAVYLVAKKMRVI